MDRYGIALVSFKRLIHKGEGINDEPFVLSSQVSQVYYVEDARHPDWAVVVKTKPWNVYDVGQGEGTDDDVGGYHENVAFNLNMLQEMNDFGNDNIDCAQNDVDVIEVGL
jgi:hypothetical protein